MAKSPAEARRQYANVIEQRRSARTEKTKGAMDKYRSMISSRRKYGDVLRSQMRAKEDMAVAEQERERRKRASVWSNIALMGTSIGSAFGPWGALVGGLGGMGVGMGIAAARGGDPLDLSAQFEYMNPAMLGAATSGIASAYKQGKPTPVPGLPTAGASDYQLQLGTSGSPLAPKQRVGLDPLAEQFRGVQHVPGSGYGAATGAAGQLDTRLSSGLGVAPLSLSDKLKLQLGQSSYNPYTKY